MCYKHAGVWCRQASRKGAFDASLGQSIAILPSDQALAVSLSYQVRVWGGVRSVFVWLAGGEGSALAAYEHPEVWPSADILSSADKLH